MKVIFSNNCDYYCNRRTDNSLSKKYHKSDELLYFAEEEYRLFGQIEEKFQSVSLKLIVNSRYSSFFKYVLLSMYRKTDHATQIKKDEIRKKILTFEGSNKRNKDFEVEVLKIVNIIYRNHFLMSASMKLKENFTNLYTKLR